MRRVSASESSRTTLQQVFARVRERFRLGERIPRVAAPMILVLLGFVALVARTVTLYVQNPQGLAVTKLERQIGKESPILGRRGAIFDRGGWQFAVTESRYRLTVDGLDLRKRMAIMGDLPEEERPDVIIAKVLGGDTRDIRKKIEEAVNAGRRYRIVATGIGPEAVETLEAILRRQGWGQFRFEPTQERLYPMGPVASAVVGFMNKEPIATMGIEREYDRVLRGTDGVRSFISAPYLRGRGIADLDGMRPAIDGRNVRLTLDATVSWFAHEELAKTCSQAKAKWGCAIVLDPRDGSIYAMESWPSFDPERFTEFAREKEPFRNRAIDSVVTPGSIFKPFVMSAAFEEGILGLHENFDCGPGTMRFGGRVLRDHKALHTLSTTEVLTKSSNIGMAQIGRRLGPERLRAYLERFELFLDTGITLGGEVSTIYPRKATWDLDYDVVSLSFGHAIALTPLRVACSLAAFANGGFVVSPRLVESHLDDQGNEVRHEHPAPRPVLSPATAELMKDLMHKVMTEGTGKTLQKFAGDVTIAGKSGTTQKELARQGRTYYTASFVGFAPVESPRVLTLVVVDEPEGSHSGSGVAGPAVVSILVQALEHLESSE